MTTLYTDNDPFCCAWLCELVKAGHLPQADILCAPIESLTYEQLAPYKQVHHFAGIGGWPLALQLANVHPDTALWTASCPCQPFSCAGLQQGASDKRHLWPFLREHIAICKPPVVFGEQVASKAAVAWLDEVFAGLETLGYACAASYLCAYSVGAPHERKRAFWVAHAASDGRQRLQRCAAPQVSQDRPSQALGAWHGAGNPFEQWQELLAKPDVRRVANGVSSMLDIRPRLRAYGNAIVPPLAATFIEAALDAIHERGAMT